MGETGHSTTYTEALDIIHSDLAVLQTQMAHHNERLGEVAESVKALCTKHDVDHEEIGKLKTRSALLEDKQGRSNWILGILQALTMGVLTWLGLRTS
jgi:glyoxylate carboligase